MTFDAAIEELHRCSGSQFDARVVKTFVKVLANRVASCQRPDPVARMPGKVA